MKDNYKDMYHDIINLPHHRSARHPHMPIMDRAAQFAPFAALKKNSVSSTVSSTEPHPTESESPAYEGQEPN
jgi:hypothetical protein